MSISTVIPAGQSSSVVHSLCTAATAVPATPPPAAKYQSQPSDWTGGWDCLHFSMNEPQYYQYEYTNASATTFACIARGDLDGDSDPSTFTIAGAADASTHTATYAPTVAEVKPEE